MVSCSPDLEKQIKKGKEKIRDHRNAARAKEKDIMSAESIAADEDAGKEIRVKKKDSYNVDMVYVDSESGFNRATGDKHISEIDLRKAINESMHANQHDFSKYGSIYELVSSEVYNVRVKGNTIVNTKMRSLDPSPPVLLVVDDKIVQDISFLDPSWVRSIELIDDVRTTMYGSMGANGVLRILLK
jgi:hypothetical protein